MAVNILVSSDCTTTSESINHANFCSIHSYCCKHNMLSVMSRFILSMRVASGPTGVWWRSYVIMGMTTKEKQVRFEQHSAVYLTNHLPLAGSVSSVMHEWIFQMKHEVKPVVTSTIVLDLFYNISPEAAAAVITGCVMLSYFISICLTCMS